MKTLKKVNEMNKEEYSVYQRILECKKLNKRVEYNDLNLLWKNFISNASLCNSCSSMLSNAYSKIIRFFENNKHLIPDFNEPEPILNKIEENIINLRDEPIYDEKLSKNEDLTDNKRACLWCSTMFEKNTFNQRYCSAECRLKMRDYKLEENRKKSTNLKINK